MSYFPTALQLKTEQEAQRILVNGELPQATETLAYVDNNNDEWHRRCARVLSLAVLAGQMLCRDKNGTRLYSHVGLYQPHGMGRGHFLHWLYHSDVMPRAKKGDRDAFSMAIRDDVSSAALLGSITSEGEIKPPPLLQDVIIVEEYATLFKSGEDLSACIRKCQEEGSFTRDLVKFKMIKDILQRGAWANKQLATGKFKNEKNILELAEIADKAEKMQEEIDRWRKRGLFIDLSSGKMTVRTHASWIISSGRFGDTVKTKPLLTLGDLDRYVWVSSVPSIEERKDIVRKVGLFPPKEACAYEPNSVALAWLRLKRAMEKFREKDRAIEIPRTSEANEMMKKYWDETLTGAMKEYGDQIQEQHLEQMITNRYAAEFIRVAYQHATLMQFKRNSNFHDSKAEFLGPYDEDFAFARDMFLSEYISSFIEVINDVNRTWVTALAHRERDETRREERAKKDQNLILEAFRKIGAKDMLILDLFKTVQSLGGPSSYVGFWKLLERASARGLIEKSHPAPNNPVKVTLTKSGAEAVAQTH